MFGEPELITDAENVKLRQRQVMSQFGFLCVLCGSVVRYGWQKTHDRDTEETEEKLKLRHHYPAASRGLFRDFPQINELMQIWFALRSCKRRHLSSQIERVAQR